MYGTDECAALSQMTRRRFGGGPGWFYRGAEAAAEDTNKTIPVQVNAHKVRHIALDNVDVTKAHGGSDPFEARNNEVVRNASASCKRKGSDGSRRNNSGVSSGGWNVPTSARADCQSSATQRSLLQSTPGTSAIRSSRASDTFTTFVTNKIFPNAQS